MRKYRHIGLTASQCFNLQVTTAINQYTVKAVTGYVDTPGAFIIICLNGATHKANKPCSIKVLEDEV